jgi:hypothetical protein
MRSTAKGLVSTALVLAVACKSAHTGNASPPGSEPVPAAAAPVFSVSSGEVGAGTTVTMSSSTPGVSITYCKGADCTPDTAGTSFTVDAAVTVRAKASAPGYTDSAVAQAVYTIASKAAASPVFNPPAGQVSAGTKVTMISTTPGASITYCTGAGCTPNVAGTTVTVNGAMLVRARASAPSYTDSIIVEAAYTIGSAGYVTTDSLFMVGVAGMDRVMALLG